MIYNVIMIKTSYTEQYEPDIDVSSFKNRKDATDMFNMLYDSAIDEILPEEEKQKAYILIDDYCDEDSDYYYERSKNYAKVSNENFEVIIVIKETTVF